MERRKKVPAPDGRVLEGIIVDINSTQENWNQYLLSDGTILKLKVVATEVVRLEGEYDKEGDPIYIIKSANVVSAIVPDELKKKT